MPVKKKYQRTLNMRLTEAEFQTLQTLKQNGGTISDLIRKAIDFYEFYYSNSKKSSL